MKKIVLLFSPLLFVWYSFLNSDALVPPSTEITEKQYDGPYVLYSRKKITVKYIFENNGFKTVHTDNIMLADKAGILLNVLTDEPGKIFSVQLKNKLEVEKTDYQKPATIVAISDIEGNFKAFRKLLQQCGVMDTSYNWTFGAGHLVLLGDFFDRGSRVTEVLWLIYSLEEKAKAAGGYVHFILGNHEIMNLSNDLRYLPKKYVQNASLLRENYSYGLYGENSELGRWLRTKNIIEKIGDLFFVHGGISEEMNTMYFSSLSSINEIARPYYADQNYAFNDERLVLIFGKQGPLWYRGYYDKRRLVSTAEIDKTLEKFNVKHIITGHFVAADTISVFRDGKLINLDVHHASGRSEALLIEGEKQFRITKDGRKFPLIK